MKKSLFLLLFLIVFTSINAQINQFDANQKRHGIWKKYFKNGNIRYQGQFNHGKEIGIFKYYSLDSEKQPVMIKSFNNTDNIASVSFFTTKGKLISKGKMNGKKRIGKWVYYHNDGTTVMQEESYLNGELNGKYTTYFLTKKPTIEANYLNGLLHGAYKRYSFKGHVYQELHYKNGVLDGKAIYYNRLTGKLIKKGQYKNDKKVGTWEFYKEGELIETVEMKED